MGGLRGSGWFLICIQLCAVLFSPRHAYASEKSRAQQELLSRSVVPSERNAASERVEAKVSEGTVETVHGASVREGLGAKQSHKRTKSSEQGIASGAGTPEASSREGIGAKQTQKRTKSSEQVIASGAGTPAASSLEGLGAKQTKSSEQGIVSGAAALAASTREGLGAKQTHKRTKSREQGIASGAGTPEASSREGLGAKQTHRRTKSGERGIASGAGTPKASSYEGLGAKQTHKRTKSGEQVIVSGAGTPEASSPGNNAGNGVASVGAGDDGELPAGYQKLSVTMEKHVRTLTEPTRTDQSSPRDAAQQSSYSTFWSSHRVKRMNRHSDFSNSLAAYAKRLTSRALTAGQELIELLATVEGLSHEQAALLLKLIRTWPDIRDLLKQYEHYKIQSQEQLLSSLVQYRARATDLATRPRPRILASRAIHAYITVGEPLFHEVMAAFLFAVVLNEPTRLRDCREYYLPMLQVSLCASALMLHHVHSTHSRDCLEVIERRIMRLEHLGRVARAVQEAWRKLVPSRADGVN